jgi:hypothetical protein
MIESIFAFIGPILAYLSQQYGPVAYAIGVLVFISPVVSLVIELLEAAVMLTASTEDDVFAAKVKAFHATKIQPMLELLPHVNVPIAPAIVMAVKFASKGIKAALAAIGAWKSE